MQLPTLFTQFVLVVTFNTPSISVDFEEDLDHSNSLLLTRLTAKLYSITACWQSLLSGRVVNPARSHPDTTDSRDRAILVELPKNFHRKDSLLATLRLTSRARVWGKLRCGLRWLWICLAQSTHWLAARPQPAVLEAQAIRS